MPAVAVPGVALGAGSTSSVPLTSPNQGQGNPLGPLTPSSPVQPTTTSAPPVVAPTQTSSSSGGTFSGINAIAIALGALLLIAGISFFIWYDARKRAPIRHRAAAATAGGAARAGSKPKPKQRKLSPAERRRRKRGRAR
jgi:predicted lipid-binding transport protein (Tim44 family)